MKIILTMMLVLSIFVISACGVTDMVDGAIEMSKTVQSLTSELNVDNLQELDKTANQLVEQWDSIDGLVQVVDPDLYQEINQQVQIIEELTSANSLDQAALEMAIRSLSVSLNVLQSQ